MATKIVLRKPHTHAGRDYEPGHVIAVDDDTAEWLVGIHSAERVPADTPAQPPAKPGKPKE